MNSYPLSVSTLMVKLTNRLFVRYHSCGFEKRSQRKFAFMYSLAILTIWPLELPHTTKTGMSVNIHQAYIRPQAYNNCNQDYWSNKGGIETLEIGRTHECLLFRGRAEDILRHSRGCKCGQGFVILVFFWQLANEKEGLETEEKWEQACFLAAFVGG